MQVVGCWLDAAPERTEVGLQQTGKLASSRLKDVSRGGRHNRADNGKNRQKQEGQILFSNTDTMHI